MDNKEIDELHDFIKNDITQDEIELILKHRKEKEQTAGQSLLFLECVKVLYEWTLFLAKSKNSPTRAVFFNEFGYKPPVGVNSSDVFRTVNKSLSMIKTMVGIKVVNNE